MPIEPVDPTARLAAPSPTQHYADNCEHARRDRNGVLDVTAGPAAPVADYAAAGVKIDVAKQHLDESLPNGQLARTRSAYMLLRAGVEELGVWLRSRGVEV